MEAQAQLDQAEIDLGYTEIRSPIDGQRPGTFTWATWSSLRPDGWRR